MIPGAPAGDAGGGAPGQGSQPPPLPVQVLQIQPRELQRTLTAVGSLQSPETTTVAADFSGIVVELDTPEGRAVQAGHVLARLDSDVSRAALSVAEAREKNARAELARIKPLFEEGVVPLRMYDSAVAELETAEGLLEQAKTLLGKRAVRAPFTGVLSLQTAQLGQYLSSGEAIVQITKIDPLELVFAVPEADATKITIGQHVEGRVGRCGQAFAGTIEAIDPTIDRATRTLSVQARVPNGAGLLRPGMSATLRVIVGSADAALVVPSESLIRQGTRYLLFVVDDQNQVDQRQVAPGEFYVDETEILAGLTPGERIVVAGHQKLRPGLAVQPLPWEPVDNPFLRLGQNRGEEGCP